MVTSVVLKVALGTFHNLQFIKPSAFGITKQTERQSKEPCYTAVAFESNTRFSYSDVKTFPSRAVLCSVINRPTPPGVTRPWNPDWHLQPKLVEARKVEVNIEAIGCRRTTAHRQERRRTSTTATRPTPGASDSYGFRSTSCAGTARGKRNQSRLMHFDVQCTNPDEMAYADSE